MKAEIITIGDEILIGQILDTNSAWMGQQLNALGIEVYQVTSIHDNRAHILQALQRAKGNADIVLITGGLGPTKDDITKKVLCEYFDSEMHYDEATLEAVERRLAERGIEMLQINKDQALVPDKCKVLFNDEGTAPGMWFEQDGVIYVSMPGVPYEMKSIMQKHVLPAIKSSADVIIHRTTMLYGIPESALSEILNDWEDNLPKGIKLAYLPHQLMIRLRLSAHGNNEISINQQLDTEIAKLTELVGEHIFSYKEENLGQVIAHLLEAENASIAVAESCTGGSLAHMFTQNAGSSAYFKGGIVAYANEVKQQVLGVSANSLESYGAVSEEVAKEMVQAVLKTMHTDYAIATTGIAGPGGGSSEKPVGTVWIAVASKAKIITKCYHFNRNRAHNIERTIQSALFELKQLITTKE